MWWSKEYHVAKLYHCDRLQPNIHVNAHHSFTLGKAHPNVTATDIVLTITEKLRQRGVVDKFVEFFGPGLANLSLADRAVGSATTNRAVD